MTQHADDLSFSERMLLDVRASEGPDGRLPMPDLSGDAIFPFDGEILVRHLDDAVVPEPPRIGDPGGKPCNVCAGAVGPALMSSRHWSLVGTDRLALPAAVLLLTTEHCELSTMPMERTAELGPLMRRIEGALMSLGGIGRVHTYIFGDGSAHFHMWFVARPEGLLQLRGSCLMMWDDLMPKRPEQEWRATMHAIVAALEAAGGLVP